MSSELVVVELASTMPIVSLSHAHRVTAHAHRVIAYALIILPTLQPPVLTDLSQTLAVRALYWYNRSNRRVSCQAARPGSDINLHVRK